MSQLSQFMPPGYVEWQAVKTASFTAEKSKAYPIDTTSSTITVTMPASASRGDTIVMLDYTRTWDVNNVTVLRNGLKIQSGTGDASNSLTLDKKGSSYTWVYIDTNEGWVPQIEELEVNDKGSWIAAGNQLYTGTGSHTWTVPAGVTECCVVCVGAGGKSGIGNSGQAAGGGALAYKNAISVVPGQTASITVGATGNHSGNNGNAGGNSTFTYGSITVQAGGGGGGQGDGNQSSGMSAGSGGTASGATGGGSGGDGGIDYVNWGGPGGGGAGGYSGNGGNGASTQGDGSNATQGGSGFGGAAGGGGKGGQSEMGGGGGGGVGMYGEGSSGTGGQGQPNNATAGGGGGAGSSGSAGGAGQGASGGNGGNYGGGQGGPQGGGTSNSGANGAVRIIWGTGRNFPNNASQV